MQTAAELQILQIARDLILGGGWSQRAEARDAFGRVVRAISKRAVSFCPLGAIERAAEQISPDRGAFIDLDRQAAKRAFREANGLAVLTVSAWNDAADRTREHVVAAFDRAIAKSAV